MTVKFLQRFHMVRSCLYKQTTALLSSPTNFKYQKNWESSYKLTSDPFCEGISEIIDTRSSDEYNRDHIPGAINLPVLHNNKRADVGTIYSKNSIEARITGAVLVTKHMSEYLQTHFRNKPQSYTPLIYCWRGGQRSKSMGIILSDLGFQTYVLDEGYKIYRQQVREDLMHLPLKFKFNVISGLAGCGKTDLLRALEKHGEQILDLEGIAKHKGSVLGQHQYERQPSQKYWESLLRHKLLFLNPDIPVWVESESIRIGRLYIPQQLFIKLCESKKFCIDLPIRERIKHTLESYNYYMKDIESLKNLLNSLRKFHSNKTIDDWIELAENGAWEDFVHVLLKDHYDKMYTHSQNKNSWTDDIEHVILSDLTDNSVNTAVEYLIKRRQ